MDPSNGSLATPELDVDEILRRKRKARGGQKACYPCRSRKVKCSYESPCKTCIDREHPELCSYHPPAKRQNLGNDAVVVVDRSATARESQDNSNWMPSRADWDVLRAKLDRVEQCLFELRRDAQKSNGSKKTHTYGHADDSDDSQASILSDSPTSNKIQGINTNNDLAGENVNLSTLR